MLSDISPGGHGCCDRKQWVCGCCVSWVGIWAPDKECEHSYLRGQSGHSLSLRGQIHPDSPPGWMWAWGRVLTSMLEYLLVLASAMLLSASLNQITLRPNWHLLWLPSFYWWCGESPQKTWVLFVFEIILDLQKSFKDSTERSCVLFPPASYTIMSYITKVHLSKLKN